MLEEVLDLGREVEGHAGKFGVHRADDAERLAGPVQKIGVAERDVGRAGQDLPPDILQDDVLRHDEEAAFVHRHDGTMQAEMQAPAAGLDVANHVLRAGAFKMRVPLQRRQSIPAWNGKRRRFRCGPIIFPRWLTPSTFAREWPCSRASMSCTSGASYSP